ncbi:MULTISPECIES: protein-L-isoaspartate(D-aspartate) O-methyltransferase [Gammaproteobacteria]|uniref:Protein-L-isoaspartate O-methyltransferase n=1 Tax=Vreelandella halophila TaxID=86177 RepID=A0A9X4YAT8_9GAMM|nr:MULTISPECIES: protein-L-isoaspartate(D-aspartate) O-methyltransferase [Gammaproteobacteria]KAA8985247.1 protein-L-isoaspartate(D-aspartate) O-methyltransferase [Halospina sp. K52047b]MYL25658.1 protein-L-isoaspartate(D-aspartate) O-methyltransferase [Halomonas utahensis]MYL74894.1 protein-L-isoaspartate(D-aspartate) O-methyltransferase [Halomonas sp. 22501_18_FS]
MNTELQGIGMTSQRTRMRLVERLSDEGIQRVEVLDAIANVPRHIFLDEALSHRAYEDTALPIGYQQTLSQPYVVARMTEMLLAAGATRILELGTGSGYQAAILAYLGKEVYSIERIGGLHRQARERLQRLGYRNAHLRLGDGSQGWPEAAPFDGMILTAAPGDIPAALYDQLADGGSIVAPLGRDTQMLTLITRNGDEFERREIEPVRFVPVLGGVVR